jgi:hypothetical protein
MVNGLETCTAHLLRHLFEIKPEAVKLFHFIHEWIASQRFAGLKSYAIALLVVFYLQNEELMSPVKTVQKNVEKKIVAGTENKFSISKPGLKINFPNQTWKFSLIQATTFCTMSAMKSKDSKLTSRDSSSSTAPSTSAKSSQLTKPCKSQRVSTVDVSQTSSLEE